MTTYQEYEDHILRLHLSARCGDKLELQLLSGSYTEPPERRVQRCMDIFVHATGLIPHEMAVSRAHFAALDAKAIDVIWNPELLGLQDDPEIAALDATTIPVKITYVVDAGLAPGSVAARYEVAMCPKCQAKANLVAHMQEHGFAIAAGGEPGTIVMVREEPSSAAMKEEQ